MVLNYAELSSGTIALFITTIVISLLRSWIYDVQKEKIEFQDKLIEGLYRKFHLLKQDNNTEETENTIEIYRWKDYWW